MGIGSTWAQEMVWLLGNKLDYEGAKNIQTMRSPLLEMTAIMYEDYTEWVTYVLINHQSSDKISLKFENPFELFLFLLIN